MAEQTRGPAGGVFDPWPGAGQDEAMYPERVVVVGGGTMGAGIAQSFATVGSTVTVIEASQEFTATVSDRLNTALVKAQERGKIDSAAAVLARIDVRTGALPTDAELYVEAVPEDVTMKLMCCNASRPLLGWRRCSRRTPRRCRSPSLPPP